MMTADAVWYKLVQVTACPVIICTLNMTYLTDSHIVFTLKMKSVSKSTIFGLKIIVNSGLEKFILKSFHGGR